MASCAGGSSAPSYSQAIMDCGKMTIEKQFKIPMEKSLEARGMESKGSNEIQNQEEKQQKAN